MTDRQDQELERLNAFIDGELDVEGRAEVTARAAKDPAYARKLASLSRLKATVADAIPVPDIALPQAARPPRRRIAYAVAAACLVLLIAAGVGWTTFIDNTAAPVDFALDYAIGMHRDWKPQPPDSAVNAAARPVSAILRPNVPDLSANGLDLAYVGTRKTAGGSDMMVIGYLGSRGCRLTMLVDRPARPASEKIVRIGAEDVLGAVWQAGPLRYALLAEGMAGPRFRLISGSVQRASLRRLPIDQETRTALARNRAASRPCRA